ncbi:hypothetical protein HZH66_005533 [Vespula vulgaris]|uniref:Uncharacterized protein n=1 Tax=Vespula vulgaris TaxID=7454 RepID=A0A834K8K6_VESVU|nr:hypothetical protein HZH66_005533 [Vespula vulgaris]
MIKRTSEVLTEPTVYKRPERFRPRLDKEDEKSEAERKEVVEGCQPRFHREGSSRTDGWFAFAEVIIKPRRAEEEEEEEDEEEEDDEEEDEERKEKEEEEEEEE